MFKTRLFVASLLVVGCIVPAFASPQESVTYSGINSDGLLGAPVNANTSTTFSGPYTAYRIRINAQITEVNTNDFGSEGRIYVTPPVGQGFVIQPFTTGSYVGSLFTTANGAGSLIGPAIDCVMNLPAGGIPAAGTWSFRFYESLDDAGTDKTWNDITITLDDDPPAIIDLSGPNYFEVEVNDMNTAGPPTVLQPNPNYNRVFPMVSGEAIVGQTTGTSTNGGFASIDYFRVEPAPDPFGNYAIYEYTLTITTGGTAGHTGIIRGHAQLSPTVTPQPSGFIDARTDGIFQQTSTIASGNTPARTSKWYGFAKAGEAILYSIQGTSATTGSYQVTLNRTPISPIPIPGVVVSGPVTIARAGHTTTVDMWLYNSNYDPIAGAGADANTSLTRTLGPGVYYLAVSNQNLGNELPSPPDSSTRTGNVLNHPNTIANSSTVTVANMNMSVTSAAGTISSSGAAKAGGFDIVWLTFSVVLVDCNTNGTNDSSEAGYADCNSNGTMDSCDIDLGSATNCNTNAVPDACELAAGDCDANSTLDVCELIGGIDCNTDGLHDFCALVQPNRVGFTSTDVPKAIPDNNVTGASSTLIIGTSALISDVDVQLDMRHTFMGDLVVVVGHGTAAATLANRRGGTGENFTATLFSDEAALSITQISATGTPPLGPPYTGTFRPESLLSVFDASDQAGLWTLLVFDQANVDTGTLTSWTIFTTTPMNNDCNSNGTPDQCDADANTNGTADDCDTVVVPPGQDCWHTECGQSQTDFKNTPIPCNFFDPGSEPFDGIVLLGGGNPGGTDTVLQRLAPMTFSPNWPETVQVPIEIVSLNLVSCQPITVRYATALPDELWTVRVDLSTVAPPPGVLSTTKTHANGGFFTSQFFVQPLFTFTRISDNATRQIDTGLFGMPPILMFSTQPAPWVHTATIPVGPSVCGVNFVPGVQEANVPPTPGSNCTSTTQCLKPVGHASGQGHLHVTGHVGTPCPCGACCDPGSGNCTEVSGINPAGICAGMSGTFKGIGSSCVSADGDSIPDSYETSIACTGPSCLGSSGCTFGSSPARADTDGDGLPDGIDAFPTNPCLPLSAPNRPAVCDQYDATPPGDGDCNDNGTCDLCEIQSGVSHDSNGNGVPDSCEPDCDGNNLPDSYDLGVCGTGVDANTNGTIDSCETPACSNAGDMNGDNLVDGQDAMPFIDCLIGSGTSCACGDMNASGLQDADDVPPFVLKLLGMSETFAVPFTFPLVITTDSGTHNTSMEGTLKLSMAAPGAPGMRSVVVTDFTFGTGSVPTTASESGGISFLLIDGSGIGVWDESTGQLSLSFSHHVGSWLLDQAHPPIGPEAGTSPKDDTVVNALEIWVGTFEGTAMLSGGGQYLDINGAIAEDPQNPPQTAVTSANSTISTTTTKKTYTLECKKERINKRKICVQPVFVKDNATDGSPTGESLADYKASTIEVWAKACVEVEFKEAVTVIVPGGKNINDINTHDGGTNESSPQIDNLRTKQDEKGEDECVEVFFVSTMSNANSNGHEWGDGVCYGDGKQAKIIVADQGGCNPKNKQVCAHEMGHAMGLDHPDPPSDTCMDPTGDPPNCAGVGTKKVTKDQATSLKSPLLKEKAPKEECCMTYD